MKNIYTFKKPLVNAYLWKRSKRFFAHIRFDDKEPQEGDDTILAHLPNTGRLTFALPKNECPVPVAVSQSSNPKRSLKYTVELTKPSVSEAYITVNTHLANPAVENIINQGLIPELLPFQVAQREVKILNSKFDFSLKQSVQFPQREAYLEVKSVSLKMGQTALFPDAPTERGRKHLEDLIQLRKQGMETFLLYFIAVPNVQHFAPHKTIDPLYANLLKQAVESGVKVITTSVYADCLGLYLNSYSIPLTFEESSP